MKSLLISVLFFIIILPFVPCRAIDIYNSSNARAYSMGNTCSLLPGFTNPSSRGFSDLRYASLNYINRYGVKELATFSGEVNFPNKYLNAGLRVSRCGFDAYNETLVGINFYKKLSSFVSLGIRCNYMNLCHSATEPSASLITADIGLLIKPTANFLISVLAINPLQTELEIGEEKQEVPVIFSLGAGYQLSDAFLMTAEVEKDVVYPVVCKLGMEYVPIKELSIRAGMYARPFTPSFGVGLHLYSFALDLAFNRHAALGFYSCCGLQFEF